MRPEKSASRYLTLNMDRTQSTHPATSKDKDPQHVLFVPGPRTEEEATSEIQYEAEERINRSKQFGKPGEPPSFYVRYMRVSMGLTVSRKTAKNLTVRRKNWKILTVSRKL